MDEDLPRAYPVDPSPMARAVLDSLSELLGGRVIVIVPRGCHEHPLCSTEVMSVGMCQHEVSEILVDTAASVVAGTPPRDT